VAKKLTAISIENLKAGTARREIPDGNLGLYHIVQPSGVRSWAVRYRRPGSGKTAKLTIGKYPPMTLAQAREKASAALLEVAEGRDPGAAKQQAKAEQSERDSDTVAACFEKYFEQHCKKHLRAGTQVKIAGMFRNFILPAWGGNSVHDFRSRRDLYDLAHAIAKEKPVQANRVTSTVSAFFRWLEKRDIIADSPFTRVEMPTREKPRERVLSDPEIVRFWRACDAIPAPFGDVYKLLLLTGARKMEISKMQFCEVNEQARTWELPAARSKNGKARITPLSKQSFEIIARQPRIAGSDYVFSRRTAHSHQKAKLDKAMQPDSEFIIHDLRRTTASGLQKIGIDVAVTEKILGHESGSFKGIVSVYQTHSYLEEKRAALQMWANTIDALVKGDGTTKVLNFGKRRRG
jgi:integrase